MNGLVRSLTEAKGGNSEEDGSNSGNFSLCVWISDAVDAGKTGCAHGETDNRSNCGENDEDSSGNPVAGNA